jgi:hypothetical protein
VSGKRVSEMTDAEIQQLAGARPVTQWQATSDGRTWLDARDRYDELTQRDLSARARAILVARGEYDPEKHGRSDPAPLSLHEHLEVLANGEAVARVYRHPVQIDHAVKAGATWQQVADATGASEDKARQEYREWAEGQHRLWHDYEGKFGMGDQEYREALARAEEAPDREAGS